MKFFVFTALLAVLGMAAPILAQSDNNTTSPAPEDDMADGSTASFLQGSESSRTKSYDYEYFIKLMHYSNKCVSFDPYDKRYYARIETCNSNNHYQDWYYDDGYIKSKHPDFYDWCLTYDTRHSKRYLRVAKCYGAATQRWKYNDDDYRFRSEYNRNYCIDYCRDCGGYVQAKQCSDKDYYDQDYELGHDFWGW
jgi:hypothetical protein